MQIKLKYSLRGGGLTVLVIYILMLKAFRSFSEKFYLVKN